MKVIWFTKINIFESWALEADQVELMEKTNLYDILKNVNFYSNLKLKNSMEISLHMESWFYFLT